MATSATDNNDDDDEIMCDCTSTTRGDIKKLFLEGRDMDGISSKTGILTGCGGCEWDIEDYLASLKTEQSGDE